MDRPTETGAAPTRKMTLAGLFAGLAVLLSLFAVPVAGPGSCLSSTS